MLYDLSFLERGKPWPPPQEEERLKEYINNRKMFKGKHFEEYVPQFERVQRVVGQYFSIESFHILLNFHKLVSVKTADLIFGEPPQITTSTDGTQVVLDRLIAGIDLFNIMHASVVDASMLGDTVHTKIPRVGQNPLVTVNPPDHWFPIVDRMNIKNRLYDVQAWPYAVDDKETKYRLNVMIHRPDGLVELQEYELKDDTGPMLAQFTTTR